MRTIKFIHIRLLMVLIVIMITFISECKNIEARENVTTKLQKVTVEITKVNKEYIEIILVNTGKEYFPYWGGFTLEKLEQQKWQRKNHINGITFPKTKTLTAYSTKIIRIRWKDYYGSNLSRGKYKIKLVKEKIFDINDTYLIEQTNFLRNFDSSDIIYSWFDGVTL